MAAAVGSAGFFGFGLVFAATICLAWLDGVFEMQIYGPRRRVFNYRATVSVQRLAQYAGLYWKKEDEQAVRIVLQDGKLFWDRSAEERRALTALSESRFQLVVYPTVFTFDRPRLANRGG